MSAKKSLDALRRQIDEIDDRIHDLLMQRTDIVEDVRVQKKGSDTYLRPDREAEILRRLIDRHKGAFPKTALIQVWREIISALTLLQGPMTVAVVADGEERGNAALARDQFGIMTPLKELSSARRVIDAVSKGEASVGVLPLPRWDDQSSWWLNLLSGKDAPKIIARLPFAITKDAADLDRQALAICQLAQEKTGKDRTFLAIEADQDIGIKTLEKALDGNGLKTVFTAQSYDAQRPEVWFYLVEVDDYVGNGDARLERFTGALDQAVKRVMTLGGYAVPIAPEELAKAAKKA
ncbi:MAG: chorismate mutase [Rhodospirillales bacterium]|nr:chorismate mutase [Rhodospirillales bacterium]